MAPPRVLAPTPFTFGYQPHLEGGVEIYRILALNFHFALVRYSLPSITRLTRPIGDPSPPGWHSPWHGRRSTSCQPSKGSYLKPGLPPITSTEETLEWGCSASRGKQCLHFRVGFFPALPGRPSGSPGGGFSPFVLR